MRPKPTTPTVFSSSSTPVSCLRSQRPAFTEASARPRLRSEARISAIASSAAETMLEVGALMTMTPADVAAATSTLSRPTPARATTLRWSAAA